MTTPGTPEVPAGPQLYRKLAAWWPLISPPEDYAGEAAFAATLLGSAAIPVHDVLELGSGGGHNAHHLKRRFRLTLTDLSPDMLAVSRRLNPECEHHAGDMRTLRLGRGFDAVFVHDAIAYMTTEDDLRLVMATAFAHCRPGGAAVLVPDWTSERFIPGTYHGGSDGEDGRAARFLQWEWDADPADTWVEAAFAFLMRDSDGSVHAAHETHRLGLFGQDTWLRLLGEAGFRPQVVPEITSDDRPARLFFVGHRPAAAPA